MTDFELFQRCFPEYELTEALFDELTNKAACTILRREGGVAYVAGDCIAWLAVAPEKQGQGIGSALLAECEACIRAKGHDKAHIRGIFPGAPASCRAFFAKHGYDCDEDFIEMGMDIAGYVQHVCPTPEGVTYRWYDGDHDALLQMVDEVDSEWPQYFANTDPVLCAYVGDELASFCIVEDDVHCLLSTGSSQVASIGCVGTRPKFRRRGIGLVMVEYATELVATRGATRGFIHYTSLESWYGRLGYRRFLQFAPMEKSI